ncbi:uncharacterized protein LOC121731194 [Aricia agestis]|uniref:uncharacterized protein LOC121731194 n=1 Tax=Aricia agestis TaxID=91739 RepID=UPI001C207BB8|nr:uncharacterized protein LOC121731194 [Aricia agestis]
MSSGVEISTTTETIELIGTNDLPPEILTPVDQAEPKRNVTRVRKQKRRRVVHKTIVPIDNNFTTEKIKEPETTTTTTAKYEKHILVTKDFEKTTERYEKKVEPTQTPRLLVTNKPEKVESRIQEQTTTEKLEQNKKNAGGPRTFPKRPPEFNPVFKKRRERDPVVRIVNEKNFVYGHNGNFHFSFEGADGTKVFSKGNLLSSPLQQRKAGEAVVGGFAYKDEEGNDYSLSYTADEHGYQPVGAHLPTPPPIPPEIARALEFLATKPNPEPTERYYYQ